MQVTKVLCAVNVQTVMASVTTSGELKKSEHALCRLVGVCSILCEDDGISLAGMIVCGLVLSIVSVVALVYIMRRRKHRQHLTEEHARELFEVMVLDSDIKQPNTGSNHLH